MVEHDIFTFCLRRSGHTAITNWIASQVQPSHSLKDCNMTGNKLSTPIIHIIDKDKRITEVFRNRGNEPSFETKEQRSQELGKYKLLLSAFEDSSKIDFSTGSIRNIVERYGLVKNPKIVITVRDPFNLFASRVWRNRKNLEVPYNGRAINWFNRQLHQFETEGDFVFIDYYQWASVKSYREQLTHELGIPFTTDKFHDLQANISSFDDFDGDAVKKGFGNRYEQFIKMATDKQKSEYLELLDKIDIDLCCRFFMHMDCRKIYSMIKEQI